MTEPWNVLTKAGVPTAVVDLDRFDANAAGMLRRSGGMPIRVASKSIRVRSLIERALSFKGYQGVLGYSVAEAIWLRMLRTSFSPSKIRVMSVPCFFLTLYISLRTSAGTGYMRKALRPRSSMWV